VGYVPAVGLLTLVPGYSWGTYAMNDQKMERSRTPKPVR